MLLYFNTMLPRDMVFHLLSVANRKLLLIFSFIILYLAQTLSSCGTSRLSCSAATYMVVFPKQSVTNNNLISLLLLHSLQPTTIFSAITLVNRPLLLHDRQFFPHYLWLIIIHYLSPLLLVPFPSTFIVSEINLGFPNLLSCARQPFS